MLELAIEGIKGLGLKPLSWSAREFHSHDNTAKIGQSSIQIRITLSSVQIQDYPAKWYLIDELVELVQFVGVQRLRQGGDFLPCYLGDAPMDTLQYGADFNLRDGLPLSYCLSQS